LRGHYEILRVGPARTAGSFAWLERRERLR
jgi:hypothetical protein